MTNPRVTGILFDYRDAEGVCKNGLSPSALPQENRATPFEFLKSNSTCHSCAQSFFVYYFSPGVQGCLKKAKVDSANFSIPPIPRVK